MIYFEDIDTNRAKMLIKEHPEVHEGWPHWIEAEEEMQRPDLPPVRPFQKVMSGDGECIGIAIINFFPKRLLSKPYVNIFALDIWDEANYSKEDMREAIMKRYPEAAKITIGSGRQHENKMY